MAPGPGGARTQPGPGNHSKGSGFSGDALGQYNLKQPSSHVNLTTIKHKKNRLYALMKD